MALADRSTEGWDLIEEIVDKIADGIVVTDSDGRLVFVNAKIEECTGYSRSELLGRSVASLLPRDLRAVHHAVFLPRSIGTVLQTALKARDGSVVPVEVALSSSSNRSGEFVIGTVRVTPVSQELEAWLHVRDERQRTS